jgi:hypothetical protein
MLILLTGTCVIPLASQVGTNLGFTSLSVSLVIVRSAFLSIHNLSYQVSLQNYALSLGTILAVEAVGGIVLTILAVWPILIWIEEGSLSGTSFVNTCTVLGEVHWILGLFLVQHLVFAYQIYARLN